MRRPRKRLVVWLTWDSSIRIVMAALLIVLMTFMYTYELPSTRTWSEWSMPLSGRTIALDAGHGGPDGGAVSPSGIIEKDINLAITLYLRDYLQQAGALVVLTRETDTDLAQEGTKGLSRRKTEDLLTRAEYINGKKADMFISIHLNSYPSPQWSGAQTFFYPNHPDNASLSKLIQEELKKNLENTERVPKQADKGVYLLKTLKMPSALVEVGFLSNPEESRMLADDKYQKKVAASIYQGVLRYFSGEKVRSS
ncbi:N-acetylmuramoyl-L-alanine amidase CwlD [Paenibacillus sp. FJAT-26967]|uniref:N-acetylmuramoyl-L-alanine amidase CwlD n=1 Tax=Paenibacillus sp. FJAT-26967 TaxID=1729690 RepID=UPI000837BED6|nr:N-acetylmuramoyl-L-alanine amidase CwlD [Paenibacillus sp. FJAT-26967]